MLRFLGPPLSTARALSAFTPEQTTASRWRQSTAGSRTPVVLSLGFLDTPYWAVVGFFCTCVNSKENLR